MADAAGVRSATSVLTAPQALTTKNGASFGATYRTGPRSFLVGYLGTAPVTNAW